MDQTQPSIPAFATPTFEELSADPDIAPLLAFEPVSRQVPRPNGWTPDRQREFIALLAYFGAPKLAADAMGKNVSGVAALYKLKDGDSFRAAWDGAIALHQSRRPADDRRIFLGHAPGMQPRRPENRLAEPHPQPADDKPAMADEDKWDLMRGIGAKFLRKVAQEREARLAGEIVAADFYLRQITMLEVTFDLSAQQLGFDSTQLLRDIRRGDHGLLDIAATQFSDWLDAARREWWLQEREPERPPHPDPRFLEWRGKGVRAYAVEPEMHALPDNPPPGVEREAWNAMSKAEQQAVIERVRAEDAADQVFWERTAHEDWEQRTAAND